MAYKQKLSFNYHQILFLKFLDRKIWANSADPNQTAPRRIMVYTVCSLNSVVQKHYPMDEHLSSNLKVISAKYKCL